MREELREKLMHLFWLLQNQQMHSYAHGGLLADHSRGQGRILAALKLRDGISTKDLALILGLHPASLNELIAKLVRGGYVVREQSSEDKRVFLIKLTEKGKSQEQSEVPYASEFLECLTDDEQTQFGEYLDRVITTLENSLGVYPEFSQRIQEAMSRRERFMAEMAHDPRFGRGHPRFPGGFHRRGDPGGHGPGGLGARGRFGPGGEQFWQRNSEHFGCFFDEPED